MNAVFAFVLIGVLWVAIARALAASMRYRSLPLAGEPTATRTAIGDLTTWRDVPDNRPTAKIA